MLGAFLYILMIAGCVSFVKKAMNDPSRPSWRNKKY